MKRYLAIYRLPITAIQCVWLMLACGHAYVGNLGLAVAGVLLIVAYDVSFRMAYERKETP